MAHQRGLMCCWGTDAILIAYSPSTWSHMLESVLSVLIPIAQYGATPHHRRSWPALEKTRQWNIINRSLSNESYYFVLSMRRRPKRKSLFSLLVLPLKSAQDGCMGIVRSWRNSFLSHHVNKRIFFFFFEPKQRDTTCAAAQVFLIASLTPYSTNQPTIILSPTNQPTN